MEPLAEAVRASAELWGFQRKWGEERIALYADDMLFFLGDKGSSLEKVMHIVEEFGNFSGLSINWEKSSLLPVDPLVDSTSVGIPQLKITEKMKYLGIVLSKDPNLFIEDNLAPLLLKFKKKFDIWSRLPLSVAGWANLAKMIWLPQLLYLFHLHLHRREVVPKNPSSL